MLPSNASKVHVCVKKEWRHLYYIFGLCVCISSMWPSRTKVTTQPLLVTKMKQWREISAWILNSPCLTSHYNRSCMCCVSAWVRVCTSIISCDSMCGGHRGAKFDVNLYVNSKGTKATHNHFWVNTRYNSTDGFRCAHMRLPQYLQRKFATQNTLNVEMCVCARECIELCECVFRQSYTVKSFPKLHGSCHKHSICIRSTPNSVSQRIHHSHAVW